MTEPTTMLALASCGIMALTIAVLAALRGWQGWLDLKRFELAGGRRDANGQPAIERIEMADLKERIRKLESIAAGVDL